MGMYVWAMHDDEYVEGKRKVGGIVNNEFDCIMLCWVGYIMELRGKLLY